METMVPLLRSVLVLSFQLALLVLVLAASRPPAPALGELPGVAVPLDAVEAGERAPWGD